MDGADDFAVFGKQTVPALIEPLGVASDESLLEHLYAMLTDEYLPFSGAMQPNQQVCYAISLFVHPMNQPFSNGAMWPGDIDNLDVEEVANCQCVLVVEVRD